MKKFRITNLAAVLSLVFMTGFWGCNDENVDYKGPYVETDPPALNYEAAGGEQTLNVKSNRAWTAELTDASATWVSITSPDPAEGKGNGKLVVTVLKNPGTDRSTELKITASTAVTTITISQAGEGGSLGDPIYTENCGTSVEQIPGTGGNLQWPYVDQFTGWQRGGTVDQAGVVYSGSGASVRSANGTSYDPPAGKGFSGKPFVYMGSATAYFEIQKINLGGNTNFTLRFGALYQSDYASGPVFSPVTADLMTVSASFDGTAWADLTITPDGAAGWNWVSSEFKVPAGTANLYIKIGSLKVATSNVQYRFDDFQLYVGGNGPVINPGGGGGDLTPITISELNAKATSTATVIGDYKVTGIVVTDYADGNYTKGNMSIQTEGSSTAGNGILVFGGSQMDLTGFAVGDKVEIDLSTSQLQAYKGAAAQEGDPAVNEIIINNVNVIKKVASGVTVAPTTITPDQIGAFQSMYVQIANAQSVETTMGEWPATQSSIAFDVNNDSSRAFTVFVAANTALAGQTFLTGNGTIKGIAYVYGGSSSARPAAQLVPRSYSDVSGLTGDRVGTVTPVFTVNPTTVNVPAMGGPEEVDVTANVDWTATVLSGNDYIESLTPASGTASEKVTVTFKQNTDTQNTREVKVKFSTTAAATPAEYTVTLTQAKAASGGLGNPYSHVFATGQLTKDGGTATLSGLEWTYSATPYIGFDSNNGRGVQIGSSGKPLVGTYTLETASYSGNIGSIKVNSAIASGSDAVLKVYVNGTQVGQAVSPTTTATEYTFDLLTPTSGTIKLEFTNSVKAFYIKSIDIN